MKRTKLLSVPLVSLFLLLVPALVASTRWYVDGVNGNDSNNCMSPTTACKTIGHAISLALSGDSISVAPATYTENLTIGISLNIRGSGATTTIVDGGYVATVFKVSSGTHLTLSNFTIRNGRASGVINYGTLTIKSSTISGNASFIGGGIVNRGTLLIKNSTLSGNVAAWKCSQIFCIGGDGGAVFNNGGHLTINNTTLSGNTALYGGAIDNSAGGKLAMNSSTVSGNSAKYGGGIYDAGSATLQNSIVANNPSGGNCYGTGTMNSIGYNLSSDATCNFGGPGAMNNTEPMLGSLHYNGGSTQTMALQPGSPAIDAGNPSGCTDSSGHLLKTDQRGMPRPDPEDTGGCDIGAYESQTD